MRTQRRRPLKRFPSPTAIALEGLPEARKTARAHGLTIHPTKPRANGTVESLLIRKDRFLIATYWPASGTLTLGPRKLKAATLCEALAEVIACTS